jgi:hypothetical protein
MATAIARWVIRHDTMLFYANGGNYTGPCFEDWCAAIEARGFSFYIGATGDDFKVTGNERKRAAQLFRAADLSFAVVTDSPIVRGFATALGWLGTRVAAFSWEHAERAGLWLGHPAHVCASLSHELRDLRRGVDQELAKQVSRVG